MTETKYKTLINTLDTLKEKGVTSSFKVEKDKIKCLESGKIYLSKNMWIVDCFRFEGASNPSDMSILFSVECNDGNRGAIISSYGMYADTELMDFMSKVKKKQNMQQNKTKLYTPFDKLSSSQIQNVVNFLYTHLQEYGDEKKDIKKAIDYAMKEILSVGGYVVINYSQMDEIIGAVVVNKTGMGGYIPENILVYIAIHKAFRGKGIGKKLMQDALKIADGDVALHVEPDNPAKHLYEKLGFENKYLEMRYKR